MLQIVTLLALLIALVPSIKYFKDGHGNINPTGFKVYFFASIVLILLSTIQGYLDAQEIKRLETERSTNAIHSEKRIQDSINLRMSKLTDVMAKSFAKQGLSLDSLLTSEPSTSVYNTNINAATISPDFDFSLVRSISLKERQGNYYFFNFRFASLEAPSNFIEVFYTVSYKVNGQHKFQQMHQLPISKLSKNAVYNQGYQINTGKDSIQELYVRIKGKYSDFDKTKYLKVHSYRTFFLNTLQTSLSEPDVRTVIDAHFISE